MKKQSAASPRKISPLWILFFFVVVFIVGTGLQFSGYSLLDVVHIFRPGLSDEDVMKLLQPVGPKNYQYPVPSAEAVARSINCSEIMSMRSFPRNNPLCLNVFKTTSEDITQKLAGGSYDRIVLYAERSVFDAPTTAEGKPDYVADLYQNVKFMDQIAIPKMLAAYGLPDVRYINVTKPFSYLFYRISTLDEADQVCRYGDTEKVRGCAQGWFSSVIPINAVGPQMSNASPILRKTDKARFSYLTHFPSDCFVNDVFLHETSHLLTSAGMATSGAFVMEDWLNEQIAGYFEIFGAELVCGEGTVVLQNKPAVKDVPKALAEFNAVFPAVDLSHEYPVDNVCRQALITEWYRYLAKGDLKANFTKFFVTQRATTPSFSTDTILADFLLGLDKDPTSREFLKSKGCSL